MLEGFPDTSVGKESACNSGDPSSIPGWRRAPGEGMGYPLQYSWAFLVAQLVKNWPAMQETWVRKIPWRRKRLHTPVFWPGEFHGLYSPLGCKESDTTERLNWTEQTKLVEVMEFQLSYFKSPNMMLLKWNTQYVSKFGKLSSGHRTGKSQFSFQFQRRVTRKNINTIVLISQASKAMFKILHTRL